MASFRDLVIPASEAPITDGVILRRVPDGIETNIPHHCVEHSPTGYEWGFAGSGPADLALNILQEALLAMGHQGMYMKCHTGACFCLAWELHQGYKFAVISKVAHEGAFLYWRVLEAWITEHATGRCMTCGEEPDANAILPDDYGMSESDGTRCKTCGAWRPDSFCRFHFNHK